VTKSFGALLLDLAAVEVERGAVDDRAGGARRLDAMLSIGWQRLGHRRTLRCERYAGRPAYGALHNATQRDFSRCPPDACTDSTRFVLDRHPATPATSAQPRGDEGDGLSASSSSSARRRVPAAAERSRSPAARPTSSPRARVVGSLSERSTASRCLCARR
jgi:hypothetical protein